MQSRARLSSVCTLATATFLWTGAILPLSVNAETPKEGTDRFTNTWQSAGPNPLKLGDRTVGTYEISGVHRNDKSGDNMGMRCIGFYELVGTGTVHEQGSCIFADQAGDQMMTRYERNNGLKGTETLVGGTGKFAGISGTGEFTILQRGLTADDKVFRGIVAEEFHWKLP
jgi:hypothetical protein